MNKPREFWIEHKRFIDEWVYEAFNSLVDCRNKEITPIHVVEYSALEAEKARSAKLLEALHKLATESSGFLSMANRHDHGNTNMQVMQQWIDNAREAIEAYKQGEK